jgi:hypothetical protein
MTELETLQAHLLEIDDEDATAYLAHLRLCREREATIREIQRLTASDNPTTEDET